jgi:AraC-like DNA-binding protein
MKLIYEKLTLGSEEGFTFKEIRTRQFSCPWHVHAELELILTLQFCGYRMVGDDITPLTPGDLVLLGPNLPHIWQLDEHRGTRVPVRILLVQFVEEFLGNDFWSIPATHSLRRLFKRAHMGLRIDGQSRERVTRIMLDMRATSGLQRMAQFLTLLEILASESECHVLATAGCSAQLNPFDQERMDRVFRHITERLDEPVNQQEVARRAGLSNGAFSRFFKLHFGRTFPEFVNELRVGRACRLLTESDQKITNIAFDCGFNNLSNFNRQFIRLKGTTPREFRRQLGL